MLANGLSLSAGPESAGTRGKGLQQKDVQEIGCVEAELMALQCLPATRVLLGSQCDEIASEFSLR